MFSKSARYYDEIYASIDKDYAAEAGKAHQLIQRNKQSKGKLLLDVACGTGLHASLLGKYYQVEGLDLDPGMLAVAKKKHPRIRFHQGDMTDFDLGRQFDVVVCLFSSIGYVRTKPRLQKAIKNMGKHLLPGGVLLIEPWFTPKQWHPGRAFMTQVNQPDLKIVRMSYSGQKGKLSTIEFQYLTGTPKGIEHSVEIHELGLFTHQEYMAAFKAAGLHGTHDSEGLDSRGLYIGTKI
ncbi:MAG TPA: class I SAM-dependent methyltransferase [Anaerolineales bacterium]|nr:class I SAM-dependent methyltransferase [Anaerolineales bacterium]